MNNMKLTVTQISNYIKSIFDNEELLINVSVYGEITNLKPSARAIYFDIKDSESALPCVCFNSYLLNGFNFGDQVTVTGKLNYYAKTGKLSFIVSKIEKYGVGDLYKQFLELKDKLEKEGLFDESKKKELPKFVKKVGVVTSETGAVIRDIIRVKQEKNKTSEIVLFPAKVQGVGSDREIIKGIKYLDQLEDVDCIIVARGGGSFEDYQPFNTEDVARAVYECKTPIVSAIGHENDWSIIDYVADRRAGTPSIASEMVFFDEESVVEEMISRLDYVFGKFEKKMSNNLNKFNLSEKTLIQSIEKKILNTNTKINLSSIKMSNLVANIIKQVENEFLLVAGRVSNANPVAILGRGFSVTTSETKNINSIKQVEKGEIITTILKDGELVSKVENIKEKVLKWV